MNSDIEQAYREQIANSIERLTAAQRTTEQVIQNLQATMTPRTEMKDELRRMVEASVYASDKAAMEQRFQRLESGPMRAREWLALGIAGLAVLVSLTIGGCGLLFTVVEFFILHH